MMNTNMDNIIREAAKNMLHCRACNAMVPKDRAITKIEKLNIGGTPEKYMNTKRYNCPSCNSWIDSVILDENGEETKKPVNVTSVVKDIGADDVQRMLNAIAKPPYGTKFTRQDIENDMRVLDETIKNILSEKLAVYGSEKDIETIKKSARTVFASENEDKGPKVVRKQPETVVKKHNYDNKPKEKKKGFVIVIEGTDGSGKQTQANLLNDRLNEMGVKSSVYSFPNYTTTQGSLVSRYLKGEFNNQGYINDGKDVVYRNSMLYANDRMVSCMEPGVGEDRRSIIDKYNDGEVLIFDRYTQSNFIHQGIHFESNEELAKYMDEMTHIEYDVMGLPRPDMVIYLKVNTEVSLANIEKRGRSKDIHESKEHLQLVNDRVDFITRYHRWDIIECTSGISNSDTGQSAWYMRPKKDIEVEIFDKVQPTLRLAGFLNHVKYCPLCKENYNNNVELKDISIHNNSDKSFAICPLCGTYYDKSFL